VTRISIKVKPRRERLPLDLFDGRTELDGLDELDELDADPGAALRNIESRSSGGVSRMSPNMAASFVRIICPSSLPPGKGHRCFN